MDRVAHWQLGTTAYSRLKLVQFESGNMQVDP